jgi:hypothetical protein
MHNEGALVKGGLCMAKRKTHINLLLSCPADIVDELPIIREAVEEYNQRDGELYIELRHWRSDAVPSSGGSPQSIINSQLVFDADMIVAIFWTRFGTKTVKYGSGTEEEISLLMERNKNVFLYFCDRPVPPSKHDAEESKKIAAFRKRFGKEGLYWVYHSLEEFGKHFRRHLDQYFHDYKEKQAVKSSVHAAFEDAAKCIVDYGYYYDKYCFTMNCIINEPERAIYKAIGRQFEIYAFDESRIIEGFVLARHKSNNVLITPAIQDITIDIDGEQETGFTVTVEKNKSAIEAKKGFISVTQIVLDKPLDISPHTPRKIAVSYTVRVAITNKVHTVCLEAPCRNVSFYCQIDAQNDPYKVVASAFGATNLDGFDRPVETDMALSLTHHNWLLPKDGVVFCLLRNE